MNLIFLLPSKSNIAAVSCGRYYRAPSKRTSAFDFDVARAKRALPAGTSHPFNRLTNKPQKAFKPKLSGIVSVDTGRGQAFFFRGGARCEP
jgi:hypothetical protein